ncbi:hypothetical protein [Bacillus rhizoplanae]|uniref:hypothetical protein n=1 Tax=Bacillus rhizoplanae TaxID=2880966 RepID=UPI003D2011E1
MENEQEVNLEEAFPWIKRINWDKTTEAWKESARQLARRGWTCPPSMTIHEVYQINELRYNNQVNKEIAKHYAETDFYERMKETILESELLKEWRVLLIQCFKNYEADTYQITIPSLFSVIEGFAYKLIYPRFKKYETPDEDMSLARKYGEVKQEMENGSIRWVLFVSAQEFIRLTFKFANFDERRPFVINRNWVLHGRDNPSQWRKVDALRLFNALYTFTTLKFLLKNPKEQEQQD